MIATERQNGNRGEVESQPHDIIERAVRYDQRFGPHAIGEPNDLVSQKARIVGGRCDHDVGIQGGDLVLLLLGVRDLTWQLRPHHIECWLAAYFGIQAPQPATVHFRVICERTVPRQITVQAVRHLGHGKSLCQGVRPGDAMDPL